MTIILAWMEQRVIGSRNPPNAIGLHGNEFKMITGRVQAGEGEDVSTIRETFIMK